MFSRVSGRVIRGVPNVSQLYRVTAAYRVTNPAVFTNMNNIYIQKRNFGSFSNFANAFKEEYAKAKQEIAKEKAEQAAGKKATKTAETEAVKEATETVNEAAAAKETATETTEKVTNETTQTASTESVEQATGKVGEESAEASTKESAASDFAKQATEKLKAKTGAFSEKMKESSKGAQEKLKESTNQMKDKMKESSKEATEKLKESTSEFTGAAKEQLKQGKKVLGEFSSEFLKGFGINTSTIKDELKSAASMAKKGKKGKKVKKVKKTTPNAAAATAATSDSTESKPEAASTESTPSGESKNVESVESLEAGLEDDDEEEIDPLSDEALGITPEMSEEEADELRKAAKKKIIKEENYEKKKGLLRETLSKKSERMKVRVKGITWEKVKYFLRDGWEDIKGSNQKPHRVMLNEEEVNKQREEILKAKKEAEDMKEEAEKKGEKVKTELMNVDNSENIWAQVADLLKDAPLIERLLDYSNKVKDSKLGETLSYASEDLREKWETSQHPFIYKLTAVYDEMFSESDTAKAIREVRRTDPTFLEDALRDEMKNSIVPALLKAWVNADTKTLKLVLSDHAYAQIYSVIKMQQAEGLQMDKHILDIRDVQLQSAHVIERQSPAFLYLVTVQMINCIRDASGAVVQGHEDEIKQMYYYMALQQEHDDELNIMKWKIAEMQLVGEMDTW